MSDRKYSVSSIGQRLEGFLRNLLAKSRFDVDFTMAEGEAPHPDFENPDVTVKFSGPDVEFLLANRAELLLALEHICLEYLRVGSDDHARISFDANDYRMLRIEELRMSASAAAEKVKRTGRPFAFNPMNSRERRVIHLALREETEVRSESAGAGPTRQVVVYPAGMPSNPPPSILAKPHSRPPQGGGPPRRGNRPPGRGDSRPRR